MKPAKIYRLQGSKKCTMNGQRAKLGIVAESLGKAFADFRRIMPGAGDPMLIKEERL